MRRWLFCAVALASVDASAKCPKCQCMSYLTALDPPAEPRDVAVNARVVTGYVPDPSRSEHFVLRPVGGAPVATNAEQLHLDGYDTLVLTPATPLAKNTDYELVLLRGTETLPYATLHTVDVTDTTPPTWTGALDAHFEPADGCDAECNSRQGTRVEITAAMPSDDRSGTDLVAVWVTTGKSIDYASPPTGYVTARSDNGDLSLGMGAAPISQLKIQIGGEGPCQRPAILLPRGAKRIHIGLKAFDRAGNASAARELDVKLAVPHAPH